MSIIAGFVLKRGLLELDPIAEFGCLFTEWALAALAWSSAASIITLVVSTPLRRWFLMFSMIFVAPLSVAFSVYRGVLVLYSFFMAASALNDIVAQHPVESAYGSSRRRRILHTRFHRYRFMYLLTHGVLLLFYWLPYIIE